MPNESQLDLAGFHWMLEMFQNIDVGLVVLDRDYRIQIWNGFMENHSGLRPDQAIGAELFQLFPEIPADWLRHKAETVFTLNNRAFTIWEQRPYLFKFRNYRPITGTAEFMYQNITLIPLTGTSGEVGHICLIVYDVTDVAMSKQAITAANAKLERLSRTDRLTGLNNRGYWEECLVAEFRRFARTGQKATLVMFDIDHFKKVNDTHGHPAGDAVICTISKLLAKCMRDTDIGGRYGGEEFAVVLVDTDAASALYFAERLRKIVQATVVRHEQKEIAITISLGVAELKPDVADHKHWLELADQALYQSKAGGRNRATISGLNDAFAAQRSGS
jgi:diguanylate cyclase